MAPIDLPHGEKRQWGALIDEFVSDMRITGGVIVTNIDQGPLLRENVLFASIEFVDVPLAIDYAIDSSGIEVTRDAIVLPDVTSASLNLGDEGYQTIEWSVRDGLGQVAVYDWGCPDLNCLRWTDFVSSNSVTTPFEIATFDGKWIFGDIDVNGFLDAGDLDRLQWMTQLNYSWYDLTGDGIVDSVDYTHWVHFVADTYLGDANLDGEFDSRDLVSVFQAGKYGKSSTNQWGQTYPEHATWAEGDWNGDGVFGSGDLVVAFQDGGYEQGPRVPPAAVPEPSGVLLILLGTAAISRRRKIV